MPLECKSLWCVDSGDNGEGMAAQTVSIKCTSCCAECVDNKVENSVNRLSTRREEMKCTERGAQTTEKAAGKECRSRGGAGSSQTVLRKGRCSA